MGESGGGDESPLPGQPGSAERGGLRVQSEKERTAYQNLGCFCCLDSAMETQIDTLNTGCFHGNWLGRGKRKGLLGLEP